MKQFFAAAAVASLSQAAEFSSMNGAAITLDTDVSLYLSSDGTNVLVQMKGPVSASNWMYIAWNKKGLGDAYG